MRDSTKKLKNNNGGMKAGRHFLILVHGGTNKGGWKSIGRIGYSTTWDTIKLQMINKHTMDYTMKARQLRVFKKILSVINKEYFLLDVTDINKSSYRYNVERKSIKKGKIKVNKKGWEFFTDKEIQEVI